VTPAIEVHDLTVAYGDKPALWDIDLTVPAGVLMAVVGPNGAGKTTLIKSMLGLIRPVAGRTHALEPANVVAVGAAEVSEGVVRGHDDALRGGHGLELGANLGVEGGEFSTVGLGVGAVRVRAGRIEPAQFVPHHGDALRPQSHVEPDVRIVVRFGAGLGFAERSRRQVTSHGEGPHPIRGLLERVGHLSFKVQPAVEDDVGGLKLADVARRGLVAVRIDSRAHERLDIHAIPADASHHVRDDGRGADDANRRPLECRRPGTGTPDDSEDQSENRQVSAVHVTEPS